MTKGNAMAIVYNVQIYRVDPVTARPDFNYIISELSLTFEDEAYGYAAVYNREHFYNYPDTPTGFAFVTGQIDTETGENL
jgi:hypothetical protein